jgi:hypothetical protein
VLLLLERLKGYSKQMKKLLFLATALVVLAGFNSATAAPQAKSGAKCTKAGSSQTVGNKKFTCVKSGSKLIWNKGVVIKSASTPQPTASAEPTQVETTPTPAASQSPVVSIVKYKNCTEAKAAGVAPITKAKTPELYELNAGLDRDKDGVACDS